MSRRGLGIVVAVVGALSFPSMAEAALLRDTLKGVQQVLATTATTCKSTEFGKACSSTYGPITSTCTEGAWFKDRGASCSLSVGAVAVTCDNSHDGTWAGSTDQASCGVVLSGKTTGCSDGTYVHGPSPDGDGGTSRLLVCQVLGLDIPVIGAIPLNGLP